MFYTQTEKLDLSNVQKLDLEDKSGATRDGTAVAGAVTLIVRDVNFPAIADGHLQERGGKTRNQVTATESLGIATLKRTIENLTVHETSFVVAGNDRTRLGMLVACPRLYHFVKYTITQGFHLGFLAFLL